jgi:hypothetical protein
MSDEFCHRKEEYLTLRKEIEEKLAELAFLERNCVIAIAVVYAWLTTEGRGKGGTSALDGFEGFVAWGAPFLLSLFSAWRAYSINSHFGTVSDYVKTIESVTTQQDPTFVGWETFFASDYRRGLQTSIRTKFWGALCAITGIIWFVSWF